MEKSGVLRQLALRGAENSRKISVFNENSLIIKVRVIVRGQHLDALFGVMQQAVGIVDTWCKKTGLLVNPNKTEVVVFTRRYKWRTTSTLKLGGQQLKINEQAKYLGVILDKKLAWNEHLENKCKKLTATLWLCRRAIGRNWGLKPDTLLWIYTAILRPRLIYAAVVWWSRVELSTAKSRLERIRGLILRGVTGASKSTPTVALGALTGLEPLQLTIKAVTAKAAWRISMGTNGRISRKLRIPTHIASRPILNIVKDKTSTRYLFDKKYGISLFKREEWTNGEAYLPSDGDNWFTDGSKNKEKAGAGVYRRRTGMSFTIPMGSHAIVLQTEIMALLQCAYKAQEYGIRRNIRICSDSRAAITALNGTTTTSLLVWECFEALNNLATENRVTLDPWTQWNPRQRDLG